MTNCAMDDLVFFRRLSEAREHDPFRLLGVRHGNNGRWLRAHLPHAVRAQAVEPLLPLRQVGVTGVFETPWPEDAADHPRIRWFDADGRVTEIIDPYSFGAVLAEWDLHLFNQGRHWHAYRHLGANPRVVDGVPGVLFAVWAPNAVRVSVVGDFNRWDGRVHPMRSRGSSGVWELFLPELPVGTLYKFELRTVAGAILLKSDPYARQFEHRPATASVVAAPPEHRWQDDEWLEDRARWRWTEAPLSVYEVHLGSWRRAADGGFLNYRDIAESLVRHVKELGFTHIELLPIGEHPFDGSWGYQTTGFFAPTSRFGSPDDFRWFVDHCHQNGIGVLLDWVPGHFPRDDFALARFDGTALYEHEDPRRGEHRDWGTLIFNYARDEVRGFLIASANYWIEEFHIDGLRVDAVASMLYLDYSRQEGDWLPNRHGGRENLEAIDFLRELNGVIQGQHPGVTVTAEESTAWPQVSRPPWSGGLGFSFKWNMGWMHDTLSYFQRNAVHRRYHHRELTFGMLYAFSENFVLPFSHDEVVHGKRSLLGRMPGDRWQQFANLRLLMCYQFTYSGKKLLFMGSEFGQPDEWNHDAELPWELLRQPEHAGVQRLVADLNRLYRTVPALHGRDFDAEGFAWIDCDDNAQSILSYRRMAGDQTVVVILNMTPVVRENYRIGLPAPGWYREILNTDAQCYGGSGVGNGGGVAAQALPWMGLPCSARVTLPPLGGVLLVAP